MKTIRLMTCDDTTQAHIYQGALANEGIESVLHNENMSTVFGGCYGGNLSGVDILVFEDDYERALRVMEQSRSLRDELKCCPHCGSVDITMKLRKECRIKAAFMIIASLFSGIIHKGKYWIYVCNRCKTSFEQPVAAKDTDNAE